MAGVKKELRCSQLQAATTSHMADTIVFADNQFMLFVLHFEKMFYERFNVKPDNPTLKVIYRKYSTTYYSDDS